MSIYINGINSNVCNAQNVTFGAKQKMQQSALDIDTIVEKIDEEKEKKHNKIALTAGAVVIGVTTAVAIFNPRYSKNLVEKMHKLQALIADKIQTTKNNKVLNKIYKFSESAVQWFSKSFNFFANINPLKDIYVKNFCNNSFSFRKVKNLQTRQKLQNIDKKRASVTSKIHSGITKIFDRIGQFTVKQSYKKASKDFNKLEEFIKQNLGKLSAEDAKIINDKLADIKAIRSYYSDSDIIQRLQTQENLMCNLERDFMTKWNKYGAGYNNRWIKKGDHLVQNLYYWPEEILRATGEKLERSSLDVTEKLVGDGTVKKGAYNEIIDLLSAKLESGDKNKLDKLFKRADKSIRKASHNECTDYFGKKRDLVLGSAPTDIITAVGSLAISGIILAKADDKKQRTSKLVTGVIPTLAGVGVSMGMTAMLISGGKGMLIGLLSSLILNRLGILVDKHILGNEEFYEDKNDKKNTKEASVNA